MPTFHPFTAQHAITLAIGAVVLAMLITMGRTGGKCARIARSVLSFFCLAAWPMNLAAWHTLPYPPSADNLWPFQLCDVTAFIAGFALLRRNPLPRLLTYYWGLAATFQALVTPAITVGFPSWPFLTFFTQHFAIVGAALWFPLVEHWAPPKPFWKGPVIAFLWADVYLISAMAVNLLLNSNFGFTMRPPDNPSLIDQLGPWPWYLLSFQVIAMAAFLLLTLPFLRRLRSVDDSPHFPIGKSGPLA